MGPPGPVTGFPPLYIYIYIIYYNVRYVYTSEVTSNTTDYKTRTPVKFSYKEIFSTKKKPYFYISGLTLCST
jgi:hypothetical protein